MKRVWLQVFQPKKDFLPYAGGTPARAERSLPRLSNEGLRLRPRFGVAFDLEPNPYKAFEFLCGPTLCALCGANVFRSLPWLTQKIALLCVLCVPCGANVFRSLPWLTQKKSFTSAAPPYPTLAVRQLGQSEAYRGDPTRCLACGAKNRKS